MIELFPNKIFMKKKNIILIALGYVGWLAIAMKYNKKNSQEIKKSIEKTWSFVDVFIENFISIHKELFHYFEQKIVTEDNIKILEEYKQKAISEVESFKNEAMNKLEDLKEKWIQKKADIEKEIKVIYEKRQEYFDKAKVVWEDYTSDVVSKWKEYLNEWRVRLDKAFEEIKNKIK